ncbi:MAG: hypothetical protein RR436_04530 [Clostridia bacterium]
MKISKKMFSRKSIIIIAIVAVIVVAVATCGGVSLYKTYKRNIKLNNGTLSSNNGLAKKPKVEAPSSTPPSLEGFSNKQKGMNKAPVLSVDAVKNKFGTFSYMLNKEDEQRANEYLKKKAEIKFQGGTVNELPPATVDNAIKVYDGLSRREIAETLMKTHDIKALVKRFEEKATKPAIEFLYPILNTKDNKYYYAYQGGNGLAYADNYPYFDSDIYSYLLNPEKLTTFMTDTLNSKRIDDIVCFFSNSEGSHTAFYFKTDKNEYVFSYEIPKHLMTLSDYIDYCYADVNS